MKVRCPICDRVRRIYSRKGLLPVANCQSCAQQISPKRNSGHRNDLKHCTICKQWKPLDNFGNDSNRWDKLNPFCRQCNTIKVRSYRERNRGKINRIAAKSIANHPLETIARYKAKWAFPIRQICEVERCFKLGERHHNDYNKPYKIQWLCRKHHRLLHRQYSTPIFRQRKSPPKRARQLTTLQFTL